MANGMMQIRTLVINGKSYIVNATDSIKMQEDTTESQANISGGTTFKYIPTVPMISVTIAITSNSEIRELESLRDATVNGSMHNGDAFAMTGGNTTGDVALDGDGNISLTIEGVTGNWL